MEEINLNISETPKLVVNEKNDQGTIKISGIPANVSNKSVNFGGGMDLLMNPKIQSRPNSPKSDINLSDINDLEKDLTKISPKEMRAKVFGSISSFDRNISNLKKEDTKMGVSFNPVIEEAPSINLGEKTNNLEGKNETWDGFKKFNDIPVNPNITIEKPKRSPEEVLKEKLIYLRKLEALEKQGVHMSKKYSMDSNLDEMKGEYEMIKDEKEKKSSVKFQGKMLMAMVSGLEFLNQKFDPFDLKLDGWAESVHENVEDYDDVFGELHEKYGGKAKMAPELKLLFMLGGSGFMLHMTNTMFKSSMPGMDDIMRQNPDLMQQFTRAAVDTMGNQNPGFGNFMSGVMGSGPNMSGPEMQIPIQTPQSRPDISFARGNKPSSQRRPEMKGPSGDVNSLLAGLKTKSINIKKDSSSTVSVAELKEMTKDLERPKKSKRKKSERNTISLNL